MRKNVNFTPTNITRNNICNNFDLVIILDLVTIHLHNTVIVRVPQ